MREGTSPRLEKTSIGAYRRRDERTTRGITRSAMNRALAGTVSRRSKPEGGTAAPRRRSSLDPDLPNQELGAASPLVKAVNGPVFDIEKSNRVPLRVLLPDRPLEGPKNDSRATDLQGTVHL